MEPIATADNEPSVAPLPDVSELLDGMPRQRGAATVKPSRPSPRYTQNAEFGVERTR